MLVLRIQRNWNEHINVNYSFIYDDKKGKFWESLTSPKIPSSKTIEIIKKISDGSLHQIVPLAFLPITSKSKGRLGRGGGAGEGGRGRRWWKNGRTKGWFGVSTNQLGLIKICLKMILISEFDLKGKATIQISVNR